MNWDIVAGKWNDMKARVKSRWAKLTDDDLANAGAKKDELVAKIQQRYGILKDDAERQVDEWIAKVDTKDERDASDEAMPRKRAGGER